MTGMETLREQPAWDGEPLTVQGLAMMPSTLRRFSICSSTVDLEVALVAVPGVMHEING